MDDDLHSFTPTAGNSALLRQAFSRFGTGVTIVTTMTELGPTGMTVNSFSSVSLDPPLILWSVDHTSERRAAFTGTNTFCVNVLGADQLDLALHFASHGADFEGMHWDPGPGGAPVLRDVIAAFHCDTYAVHQAGDHDIILGQITQASNLPGNAPGLLFERSGFGQFAALDPDER
jgi:flavin reductase (DIM6/NTAB) family NADH-FMN oxidoreductase RutF